jgi:hypothetical protein
MNIESDLVSLASCLNDIFLLACVAIFCDKPFLCDRPMFPSLQQHENGHFRGISHRGSAEPACAPEYSGVQKHEIELYTNF